MCRDASCLAHKVIPHSSSGAGVIGGYGASNLVVSCQGTDNAMLGIRAITWMKVTGFRTTTIFRSSNREEWFLMRLIRCILLY